MKTLEVVIVKRRFLKFAPAIAIALVGLVTMALAVPVFGLVVQALGEGSNTINSPVNNGAVNFILDPTNPDYITGVSVNFDQDLAANTIIYAKIYDAGGTLIALGSTTLGSTLIAGTYVTINFPTSVQISQVDTVAIVVQGPQQTA